MIFTSSEHLGCTGKDPKIIGAVPLRAATVVQKASKKQPTSTLGKAELRKKDGVIVTDGCWVVFVFVRLWNMRNVGRKMAQIHSKICCKASGFVNVVVPDFLLKCPPQFSLSMNLSPTSHVRVCSSVCLAALQTTAGLFSALADNLFLSPFVDFYIFLGQLTMQCMSWCPSHLWHSIYKLHGLLMKWPKSLSHTQLYHIAWVMISILFPYLSDWLCNTYMMHAYSCAITLLASGYNPAWCWLHL